MKKITTLLLAAFLVWGVCEQSRAEGSGLDPYGAKTDQGSAADPNGSTTNAGSSMDPNGTDWTAGIDPNG